MKKSVLIIIATLYCITYAISQQNTAINLVSDFKNPPQSAQPQTWMHIMNGNMSKEGMTKDLEALKKAGIGGVTLFNVTHHIPKGPVDFNSPEDIALKAYTAAECERLGLSFGFHNCDGWTSSGGPWVPVEHSMKQVVTRQVVIDGGNVDMYLPGPSKLFGFYEDIAVLAYPALKSEIADAENCPVVSCSNADFDINIATNGKIDERTELTVPKNGKAWIQWDFGKPQTVRSFLLKSENQRTKNVSFSLQMSDDGKNFKDVQSLSIQRHGKYFYTIDQCFNDGFTARYFRFATNFALDIAEVNLSTLYRIDNVVARTNIRRLNAESLPKLKDQSQDDLIKKESIINLSKFVDARGVLKTTLPKGKWTIMRVGYSTTAAINDPASIEGTGLEVDKFSRESFKLFYDGYVKKVVDASKKVAPNALKSVLIDSYEVGGQNWTKGYETQFKAEYGYDIINFLPIYAGRYIDNAETTQKVLWDIGNFNNKLMCTNYFDYFTELANEDGLKTYLEPYGMASFNPLDAARKADIPMGEFFSNGSTNKTIEAISAGHIYGRTIISAEAFTSGPNMSYEVHPGMIKTIGDQAWVDGITEFVFHRYTHQPNTHVKPGMTMSAFGTHFDRTQTWWESAGKSWFQYIARGQHLLRQGHPVADVLAFVGDASPNSVPGRDAMRKLPNYINYDGVNADVLHNRITVRDGKMVLPEGGTYHALYLHNVKQIKLSTLKSLAELADQGVIILGKKPEALGEYNTTDADKVEFNNLVTSIWSKPTTKTEFSWDELYAEFNLPADMKVKNAENINYTHRKAADQDIYFFYNPEDKRRTFECTFNVSGMQPELWNAMNGEITRLIAFEEHEGKTIVPITLNTGESVFVVFQHSSKGVNALSSTTVVNNPDLCVKMSDAGKTVVEVSTNGTYELGYVDGKKQLITVNDIPASMVVDGAWQVRFPDLKNGEQSFTFANLMDWTKHEFEGVNYYSGTAVYIKIINVAKKLLASGNKIELDLGEVHEIARVILNGKDLGVVWKAPHVVDITSAIKAGKNDLRIEVTNQWTNRLIGDENFPNLTGYDLTAQINKPQTAKDPHLTLINPYRMVDWFVNNEPAPLGQRSTFTTYPFYKKGDKLLPAGLTGTVKINSIKTITIYK